MRRLQFLCSLFSSFALAAGLVSLLAILSLASLPLASAAQAQGSAALTGKVTSAQEPVMEGVLVSARRDGSSITTTVVSNAEGIYSFPAGRLPAGHYTLSIRAVGYALQGAHATDVKAVGAATADLTLTKITAHGLADQLSNGEWLNSLPGADRTRAALTNCVGCHTLERIMKSTHDAAEFMQVFQRMGTYAPGSTPLFPQRLVPGGNNSNRSPMPKPIQQKMADYLASVNLSNAETLDFPLKPFPRLKGRSTHVIITEYDLPRQGAQPHDVVMDAGGTVWYSDFSHQMLGELDPATGKVTDHPIPTLRPDEPKGSLALEFDPQGNLWLSMMYQGGILRFDPKTKEIRVYPVPKEWLGPTTQESMVSPQHDDADGKVWTNNQDTHLVYRVDVASGKYEDLGQAVDKNGVHINAYGMPTDAQNDAYQLNFGGTTIGRMDAKTKQVTIWKTPLPFSRPRRGRVDSDNILWFAEYGANGIGRFDPKTGAIKEWQLPTHWDEPYDVVKAKDGEIWTASMLTDRVARLDPKTDSITEYQLPRSTNIRRVFIDDRAPRPVLWVGSNHGASIVKVEPLD
ncbi:MAG TPA: carboxypeptidase regulatory-like domain-containing protein [Xanthobacteraceae bacterium]